MNRYPERDALALRGDLARYLGHGLSAEQIWAANGSNEVMLHVLLAFAGPVGGCCRSRRRTRCIPSTPATRTASGALFPPRRLHHRSRRGRGRGTGARPDVVLITSPNNPTGTAVSLETIRAICDVAPGVVVIDEAYYEFARIGTPSALELLRTTRGSRSAGRCPRHSPSPPGGSAIWRRLPHSSRRSASYGCPITFRRSPRPPPGSPWRMRPRCWRRSTNCGRRATIWRVGSPAEGCRLLNQTPTRTLRAVRRPPRGVAGPAGSRGADPGNRT